MPINPPAPPPSAVQQTRRWAERNAVLVAFVAGQATAFTVAIVTVLLMELVR